ncbi:RagB/SusD family nutrient uptake outer membrane protein [Sphingobacterium pedocola]|nr:RagB/SusD family nutrient uptake outer membrane protein [Sphingobacterium pedocola]
MRNTLMIMLCILVASCSDAFLDAKPDKALAIPHTLDDLQALLDDVNQQINQTPGFPELFAPEIVVAENGLGRENMDVTNTYLWQRGNLYATISNYDWDWIYEQVLRVNVVLEELKKLDGQNIDVKRYEQIRASASFFRAWHLFHLLITFSPPYNPVTAEVEPGIVLKLEADINEKLGRSSISECYRQIIADLEFSTTALPKTVPVPSRPNLAAAYALLARVYMSMYDYQNVERYAELSLAENNALMDYNALTGRFPDPLQNNNKEVLFYAIPILHAATLTRNAMIDRSHIGLYTSGDLRRELYYSVSNSDIYKMKSTYRGTTLTSFSGLTSSEMYLVCAEAKIRLGKVEDALLLINRLRISRWRTEVPYEPLDELSVDNLLEAVLLERKRELPFRGLAWFDLRRLRNDPQFSETITREYNGEVFTFGPLSDFYHFPVPPSEIMYNPDI